jgi:HlyD family secretion protein
VIKSPIDGIVLYRNIEPGQTVAASFQTPVLFTLASDIKGLELLADIDEADVGQVKEEQTASFTVDAFPNRTFDARIRSLRNAPKKADGASAAQQQGVVVYQGELSVNNESGLLKPGMTATADVAVKTAENVVSVPNGALRFSPQTTAPAATIAS